MNTQLFPGKFEIQGEIAKGQTGTIYYGYDLELRQEVAIKIYHSHINGRIIRGKSFLEKSKPLLRLEHPNLIKIFKVEEKDDTPIVIMEFFDAPSLQQVIHEKGPLSVEEMLLLARGITEVLVHTHSQGIIHSTLHPGHVLIGPQNKIKVMDLGLSWILMDILSNCEVDLLRPLSYLPPEIAKGELLNVSSDLYCLGFMMYHMLTRQVPYAGLPKTSIMGKLAFDQADPNFDFPDNVPEAICELIRHMTRNRSEIRLQEATHVLTILNQQLEKFVPLDITPTKESSEPQQVKESPTSIIELSTSRLHAETQGFPPDDLPVEIPPKNATGHQEIHRTKFKRLGFTLGIILLMVGVIMGYWYKELLGIPSRINHLTNHIQPITVESVPPIPSDVTRQHSNTSFPEQQMVPVEEHILEINGLQPGDTSPTAPQSNSGTKELALYPDEAKHVERSPHVFQEINHLQSSMPKKLLDPIPEQSKALPHQDSENITKKPESQRILSPTIPNPSLNRSEADQQIPHAVSKDPITNTVFPSEPATDRSGDNQVSTHANPKKETMQDESKELQELLDAIDLPETVPIPSTPVQQPLLPTPNPSAESVK